MVRGGGVGGKNMHRESERSQRLQVQKPNQRIIESASRNRIQLFARLPPFDYEKVKEKPRGEQRKSAKGRVVSQ